MKMYWQLIFAFAFMIEGTSAIAVENQNQAGGDGIELVLPKALRGKEMEFSSMAWYGNKLLLVPQYPEKFGSAIFTISKSSISKAVDTGKEIHTYDKLLVDSLPELKLKIGTDYEGIEATVIVKNRIWFTLETNEKGADCYVIGGRIAGGHVILEPSRLLVVRKPKRLSNAGFESLVYWPQENRLLTFFEYNRTDVGPLAIEIDPKTGSASGNLKIPVLPFRITDMVYAKQKGSKSSFLGINFFYNGKTEYSEYVGTDSVFADEPSLQGKNLRKTCYSRIVRLSIGKNEEISWKKERDISFDCDNWEGIAPFKNGVLLITDEHPASVLKWFKL